MKNRQAAARLDSHGVFPITQMPAEDYSSMVSKDVDEIVAELRDRITNMDDTTTPALYNSQLERVKLKRALTDLLHTQLCRVQEQTQTEEEYQEYEELVNFLASFEVAISNILELAKDFEENALVQHLMLMINERA